MRHTELHCLVESHIVSIESVEDTVGIGHSRANAEEVSLDPAALSVDIVKVRAVLVHSRQHEAHRQAVPLVVVDQIDHHARGSGH